MVPVKSLSVAKSRIALPPALRRNLALAMALDTVSAAASSDRVGQILVVCGDHADQELFGGFDGVGDFAGLRVRAVVGPRTAGINAAVRSGAARARAADAGCPVASLPADLPALDPTELSSVLDAAAGHARAFLADSDRTGTTLLTAGPGVCMEPRYGTGSRHRHRVAGATELLGPDAPTVRGDADTMDKLLALTAFGFGPHTAQIVSEILVTWPHGAT